MTYYTMGDLAQYRMLSGQGARLRAQMNELSVEATTGLVADRTERLRGNYVQVAGIESRLNQIAAYRTVTSEQLILTAGMQTALSTVGDQTKGLSAALLAGVSSQSELRIEALSNQANATLSSTLSALNARIGERALFAGTTTNSATFGSAEDLMSALETAVTASGAVSAVDVQAAVDDFFDDPAGFEAVMYKGSEATGPLPIGPEETAQIDVTGMDPAIVGMLKGIAMAGLLSRGVLAGSTLARSDLMKKAGESLAGTQELLAGLSAHLGTTEAAMQNAATRNDAEKNALETARLNLLSVDQYEVASKYQETQGQLQELYTLTSRASRLSLVDFL
ncbi:flagellin [Stagnihabitans tardus]|uniref:Flagellar biosynthesis protein FlgL n=1 Tax=Stagnihabitans tardus TaxID=2699202 RepID=A0AAE4Y9D0_9RHOB|nr:flagellin [Stagnihabitans tardus]NBZ88381.1 flagellar biosynthesis protein FlgL [Stagnihabitans tardus]